eukprot:2546979-Rhodomonas_salina.1
MECKWNENVKWRCEVPLVGAIPSDSWVHIRRSTETRLPVYQIVPNNPGMHFKTPPKSTAVSVLSP